MLLMSSLLLLSIRYLLLQVLMTQPAVSAVCAEGWFGKSCSLQCHCQTKICDSLTGTCPKGVSCELGYFGPGCQYVNLAFRDRQTIGLPFATDDIATTCNRNSRSTSLTLKLPAPHRLIWFRLHLNKASAFNQFLVTLDKSANLCPNISIIHINDFELDLLCSHLVRANTITIKGAMAGAVCSIFISGGRNVALKQNVSHIPTVNDASVDKVVDGMLKDAPGSYGCVQTKPLYHGAFIKLTFNESQTFVLHEIVVYNGEDNKHLLSQFYVYVCDGDDQLTGRYYEPGTIKDVYYVSLILDTPVKSVRIAQNIGEKPPEARFFTICEVQAYSHTYDTLLTMSD